MTPMDRVALLVGSAVALSMIWILIDWQKQLETKHISNIYHMIAFSVLLISSLLLSFLGWDILGFMGDGTENKMVAVLASAIPFAWASGIVSRMYPRYGKIYLSIMILGLLLITFSRFMELKTFGRIIYPVFHSTAGFTVILIPIIAVIKRRMSPAFLWIAFGGSLISMGGISMAFLIAGRQLLFFSTPILLSIMAPLLLVTTASYAWGLKHGTINLQR
ncbi:MAG: hypothetical protein K9N35_05880 [Candidatus Marinimicrobia bacterium]|nr:hypothetical protein [Candidatus Neomarinimicrobiota bacterium]